MPQPVGALTPSATARVKILRVGYRCAHVVLRLWWFIGRPHTHGVKLVVRDGEAVLFVRHSYGRRDLWELPGGGIGRGESPPQAATREAREEIGLHISGWEELLPAYVVKRDATAHLRVFCADYDGAPLRPDAVELLELRWAPRTAPPQPLGLDAAGILKLPIWV